MICNNAKLIRCVKTAEIILAKHRGVRLQTHEALRERVSDLATHGGARVNMEMLTIVTWGQYMGDWQGQPIAYRARKLPDNLEPTADFVRRADQWWTQNIVRDVASSVAAQRGSATAAEEEKPGAARNVLVVSHGGLMHVLLQHLIESRRVRVAQGVDVGRYRFPNTSVTVIDVDAQGRGTVVMFGDTTHLDVEFVGAETNADDVEH